MDIKPSINPIFSFGIVADLQYCDAEPFKNRYFRNSPAKLNIAIEEFNRHDLNFIINLGDIIDRDWQSFDKILPKLDQLKAPIYHVLGNHDYEIEDRYKPEVHHKLDTERYYDFSIENWRLIVLDGNEISTFANLEHSENYEHAKKMLTDLEKKDSVNANFWNGGIGRNQLQWLQNTLEDAQKNNQKSIIYCHYPIFPQHRHNLLNDLEMLSIIEQFDGLKIWFNGHNHDGNYGQYKNIHFVNVKGMVETESNRAFCIVDIFDSHVKISGFGAEISAKLNFF